MNRPYVRFGAIGVLAFLFSAVSAVQAAPSAPPCNPPTRPMNFHLVCWYQNPTSNPFGNHCRTSLDFVGSTTMEGGEVETTYPDGATVPFYQVTCDQNPWSNPSNPLKPIYNDGGVRMTGILGTTFMGEHGPTPQVFLGRGELHAGVHLAPSSLQLNVDNRIIHFEGRCEIWAEPATN